MEEQGFQNLLFIGDDTILLNNLLYQIFIDKKIPVIFVPTLNIGIKYIKEKKLGLIILDSILISKLNPSAVIPLIKKAKTPIFFINTTPGMWIYKAVKQIKKIKEAPITIYQRPLLVDNFLDIVQQILKKKLA